MSFQIPFTALYTLKIHALYLILLTALSHNYHLFKKLLNTNYGLGFPEISFASYDPNQGYDLFEIPLKAI